MQLSHTKDNKRNDVLVVNPEALALVMMWQASKKLGKWIDKWSEETGADN